MTIRPTHSGLDSARLLPCAFPRGKVVEGSHLVTAEGTGPEPYGPCQGLVRGQGGFQDVQARVVLAVHLPVAREAHEVLAYPISASYATHWAEGHDDPGRFVGRGTSMTLCIGLDAHVKSCVYVVKDDAGTVVDKGTIPSTPADLSLLAQWYPEATVVVEASSVTEWIYDRLMDLGMEVFPAHPANIRRVLGKKNDEVDAGFLVDAYRVGCLPRSYVPPMEIRALRQLARRCAFLTRERTRFKNRVHAILKRRGIRLLDDASDDVPSIFAKKHREELLAVADPEIPVLLELIDAVAEKRGALDTELRTVAESNDDVRNLMTIPGFGPLVAVSVYAEVGHVSRFRNADALAAYFGLVPEESQSGETRVRGHITRRGQSSVRWLLNQASWQHVRRCPASSVSKDYKRLQRRTGKKRAVTAVSRRLVKVCYHILRERRSFTLNDHGRASI